MLLTKVGMPVLIAWEAVLSIKSIIVLLKKTVKALAKSDQKLPLMVI